MQEKERKTEGGKAAEGSRAGRRKTAGRCSPSSQTSAFLTLVLVYVGAFIYYGTGLAPARPARFFLGLNWSEIPAFLLLFTIALLPALFGPGLDLFSYMNDRSYFFFLIFTFFLCVLKYYGGAASSAGMIIRAAVLLFFYAILRLCYRKAFFHATANKYALRMYTFLLAGLSAPYLAAGFSGMAPGQLLLPAALFFVFFVPLYLAGRPGMQESVPVRIVKRLCRDLHASPVPPAVFAFAPYLLAEALLG